MSLHKRIVLSILCAAVLGGCAQPDSGEKRDAASFIQPEAGAGDLTEVSAATGQRMVSEPNGVLTLRDGLALALARNPVLKASGYEVEASRGRMLQAGVWQNPELEIEVENVGGSGELSGFDAAETTVQLSQLIELGSKIQNRKKIGSFGVEQARLDYQVRQLEVCTEVARTYIQLLYIENKLQLSADYIELTEQVADSIAKRVDAGKDSPLDLSKAKLGVVRANMEHDVIGRYEGVYKKQLASFWDSQEPEFESLAGRLDEVGGLPALTDLQGLLESNSDVAGWAIEVQKRKAQVELARSESVGDLTVAGGVRYFNDDDETAFVFGLSVPLPVANQNQGGRQEAMYEFYQGRSLQRGAVLTVWNELNRLYVELENAYQKVSVMQGEILTRAEQVFEGSRISYEQGKIDYLTFLDAQKIYFGAKNEYLDALLAYHLSKTELERLIGRSLDEIQ